MVVIMLHRTAACCTIGMAWHVGMKSSLGSASERAKGGGAVWENSGHAAQYNDDMLLARLGMGEGERANTSAGSRDWQHSAAHHVERQRKQSDALCSQSAALGRGDDTVGSPRRAQIYRFELFELILLLKLDRQLPVERFEATASRSTVPSPPLMHPLLTRRSEPGAAATGPPRLGLVLTATCTTQYMCTYICTYIYIYIYIYTHTYTHTHTRV